MARDPALMGLLLVLIATVLKVITIGLRLRTQRKLEQERQTTARQAIRNLPAGSRFIQIEGPNRRWEIYPVDRCEKDSAA